MNFSSLRRTFFPAAVVSGVVFSVTTLPLATMRDQDMVIQFQEEPVFTGTLDELAVPYLGVATVLSTGVGLATMALLGWQYTSRKSSKIEEQVSELQQSLQERESLLEELRFSENRLGRSELSFFLQDEEEVPLHAFQSVTADSEPMFTVVQDSPELLTSEMQPLVEPVVQSVPAVKANPVIDAEPTQPAVAQPAPAVARQVMASIKAAQPKAVAMAAMPAAQVYNGYHRSVAAVESVEEAPVAQADANTSAQLGELLAYLKQVMTEVEKLKTGTAVS